MKLGYNTNGFAHHDLVDALDIIAELGFTSVAITLDNQHLDPYDAGFGSELVEVRTACRKLDLLCVIETGARFILDPWRKHQPTLLSADADEHKRRMDFLIKAIRTAGDLGSPIVSLWSGSSETGNDQSDELDERLVASLQELCRLADYQGVTLAFEPEPGMYIGDMAGFDRIFAAVNRDNFKLTLDVGHAHITEAAGAAATVRRYADVIVNAHLEGMNKREHAHLPPGQGDMDLAAVVQELIAINYDGPATLELSRHSHNAVVVATQAAEFFRPMQLLRGQTAG